MNLILGVLGGLMLAFPALGQKVTVDFDKTADFSHIQRYKWRTHPAFEKRPELKQKYATGIQLVLEAGNADLMKKGLQPSETRPDVFVTFYLAAEDNQKSMNITEAIPGAWYGWYGQPTWTYTVIDYYKTGILVLDVVDVATSKLMWRAYCSDTIRDMANRDKNVNATVKNAFDRFPPKKK